MISSKALSNGTKSSEVLIVQVALLVLPLIVPPAAKVPIVLMIVTCEFGVKSWTIAVAVAFANVLAL